ncbi:MAG: hypothetical protein WAM42_22965 [Candidatus Nitrosopolaris sp.]|jgi:hypothetical protein
MHKSTLLIMTATIAAIITTSVLAFALPNQVFAQSSMQVGQAQAGKVPGAIHIRDPSDTITKGERGLLAGEEAQVAKILAGHEAQAGKVLSGEEAQVTKIIPGKLDVLFPTGRNSELKFQQK